MIMTPATTPTVSPFKSPAGYGMGETRRRSLITAESLRGSSLVAIASMTDAQLALVLKTSLHMQALVMEKGSVETLKGKILACVFYEPSTRTNCSFQAAMMRLGGNVIPVNESCSSAQKGETLSDTVRCLETYCDAVVLRHPRSGAAAEAAAAMRKPLLNAGDGVGEHPTQAILDLYTIVTELSSPAANAAGAGGPGSSEAVLASENTLATMLRGKVITMVGDLKNGRTVHSLAKLLGRYDVTLHFVSPTSLRMPAEVMSAASKDDTSHTEHAELSDELVSHTDILYVTRVQKERFESVEEYDAVKDAFIITPATLAKMKSTARVLHPLPRVGEIDPDCDSDPRAAYFRQMENGMYVRMALLQLLLG